MSDETKKTSEFVPLTTGTGDWGKEYVKRAIRTNSGKYHAAENDSVALAVYTVVDFIRGNEKLIDGTKRSAFYGNELNEEALTSVAQTLGVLESVSDEESEAFDNGFKRFKRIHPDLIHGFMGLQSEICEIAEALMAPVDTGEDIDVVNLREELGDLMWYIAVLANHLKVDLATICNTNLQKLHKRFGEEWTKEASDNRDLSGEREILEQKPSVKYH